MVVLCCLLVLQLGMLNSFFKHSKFICNDSNFIQSSKMATGVLHSNGDSVNCSMAYHVGDLCHFLCWLPGESTTTAASRTLFDRSIGDPHHTRQ